MTYLTPWYLGNSSGFSHLLGGPVGFLPLLAWMIFWKGMALWQAAKRNEKGWFIIFLLVHTLGILEIIYLVFVAKTLFNSSSEITKNRQRKRNNYK